MVSIIGGRGIPRRRLLRPGQAGGIARMRPARRRLDGRLGRRPLSDGDGIKRIPQIPTPRQIVPPTPTPLPTPPQPTLTPGAVNVSGLPGTMTTTFAPGATKTNEGFEFGPGGAVIPSPVAPPAGDPRPPAGRPVGPGPDIITPPGGPIGVPPAAGAPPIPGPGAAGTALTPFGPGNTLRGQQINPFDNPRLRGVQGAVSAAATSLGDAPSLTQAAIQRFNALREASEPGFQRELRGVGQKAAALGRIGSGVTTSELGDVALRREKFLGTRLADLAGQTAFAEGGERRSNLGALGGLERQLAGEGFRRRGEVRGERGFQRGEARTAVEDRVRRRLLEEQLVSGASDRRLRELGILGGVGFGGDPRFAELTAAGQAGSAAGKTFGGVGDLFAELARRRARQRGGGGAVSVA